MYFELESMQLLRHSIDAWSCDSHFELCLVHPSLVGEVLHTFLGTLGESFCIDCIGLVRIHCKNKGVMVTPILGVKWLCENDTTFGVSAWSVS